MDDDYIAGFLGRILGGSTSPSSRYIGNFDLQSLFDLKADFSVDLVAVA